MISSDGGVAGTGAAGEAGMSGGAYAGTGYGGAYAGGVGGYPAGGYGGTYTGGVGGYPAGGYGGTYAGGAGGCDIDPNCGCCPDNNCGMGGSGEPFCVPAPGIYAPCADCARLGETSVYVGVDGSVIDCTILPGQVGCFEYCVERCDPSWGCGGMGGVGGGPAGMGGAGGVGGGPAGMGGVGGGLAGEGGGWPGPDASIPE